MKIDLRRTLRAARRTMGAAERQRQAAAVIAALLSTLDRGQPLASYAALPDELDLGPLHHAWWQAALPVWLPRVAGPGTLTWHPIHGEHQLVTGSFGIREPDPAQVPAAPLPMQAVILVPGVGFTADGHRLGQGQGFYDRLLEQHPGPTIGVAFACQRCDRLPLEPHDRPVGRVMFGG